MDAKVEDLPAGNSPPYWQPNLKNRRAPRVIAVTSGKRGVGSSCLVINLGLALARLGRKVLILDADLSLAEIAPLLDLRPQSTINDVFAGHLSLADVMAAGPHGVKVLPAAPVTGETLELSQAQKLLLLEELDTFAADFDFLLVDTGAGISGNVLYFNTGAQERIVVADNDPDSIIAAYSLIKVLATRFAEKRFKFLFNKIFLPEAAPPAFERLTKVTDRFLNGLVSLEYLGFIPFDPALPESVAARQALMEIAPDSPASLALAAIAETLLAHEPPAALDGNIKFFWQTLNRRAADAFSQGDFHANRLR